jgi:hypothetical protein
VVDLAAKPSYEEVLGVRRARVGMLRDFLDTLTDDQLGEQCDSPLFMRTPHVPVSECLWIIMNEEWQHHRYAVRDLDAIEARSTAVR